MYLSLILSRSACLVNFNDKTILILLQKLLCVGFVLPLPMNHVDFVALIKVRQNPLEIAIIIIKTAKIIAHFRFNMRDVNKLH